MAVQGSIPMTDSNATPPEHASRSPAAERMRRHRQRRRDGLRCLVIELRETEIEALIRRGLLKQETRHDANAILAAIYAFFDSALGRRP